MAISVVSGISVVIPNYNGLTLLPEILPALLDCLQETALPFEIIISDDCSTDSSVDFLQTHYPDIILATSTRNQGFAPTINRGIFLAVQSHVLLLNSDVKLTPGYFTDLLRYFEREDTFGVAGKIIGWADEDIQDGGKYPSFHGTKIKTSGNYINEETRSGGWLYTMYLSGACALVDRTKLWYLGGFEELFAPYYVEDFELSLRAWRIGWKCYYEQTAICRHKESVTIRSKSRKQRVKKIYSRNKMFLHALHLPITIMPLWHFQLFLECFFQTLVLHLYFPKAMIAYIRTKPRIWQQRQAFAKLCTALGREPLSLRDVTGLIQEQLRQHPHIIIK